APPSLPSLPPCAAVEVLVKELGLLLKMLDQENLSKSTQEKKTSVWNLLQQIQTTGPDYIYVNSSVYKNGTSFVESLFEKFDCELGDLKDVTDYLKDDKKTQDGTLKQSCTDLPPPLPTTPPPEEYYEEAVPLSPGMAPEYIITRDRPSPPNSIDDVYEDTDNHYPATSINNDSDALSSSYESYEEDEEERSAGVTHQWPSEESNIPPVRDCRICAFLLRKKRFGQWAKQFTVIRENRLQCYKNSKDTCPYVDFPLSQCSVVYVPKDSKKKHHELRFTLANGDGLVLAVQSREQAHKCIQLPPRQASGQSGAAEEAASPVTQRKNELDKVRMLFYTSSCSDSVKVKRGAFAAGRKITRIISFSKKKSSRSGDSRTAQGDPRQGYLLVLVNQMWREHWCCVYRGALHFYHDRGDPRASLPSLPLNGCEVVPGLGPKHPFAFRILRDSAEVVALEASGSDELGRWLGVILAETGSATDPESLHYDYVDVETIAHIRDAARNSFLWATSSSSTSTDSRTYDEVPVEDTQVGLTKVHHCQVILRLSHNPCTSDPLTFCSGPDTNPYGRYGKTRAEEDAKRYLREKEELEAERDGIRKALVTLRQQKKDLKEELKVASDRRKSFLTKRVAQLDEACRGKEAERVDLELRLTQVKENLKKSLAGGALGAPEEAKLLVKESGRKTQQAYSDSRPVNCAAEMRKRPPSICASPAGTVMQKAKEWELKKRT
uniref:Actin filament-associated protein 1-like 1 n=1 Tax=Fundulus heteroclitus TaxID=8078 RepID=A0A3Q2PAH0_FUNHE